jgi:Fic family protein
LYLIDKPDVIKTLVQIAKINSTISSNAIENITINKSRINALINETTKPINRNEQEVLGYKDVLNTIHESYNDIPITPNVILQFHRGLFARVEKDGNYGK